MNIRSLFFLLVLVGISAGCSKKNPPTPTTNEVWLEYKMFQPTQLSIVKGTTITFINKDNADHTAHETSNLFYSGKLHSGDKYAYTFNTPGTYYIYCDFHAINSEQTAILVK